MLVRKEAKVQKIEGKNFILELEDGQELTVQKELFKSIEVGDAFVVQIMPEAESVMDRDELSRTILNQLLNE